MEEEYWKSGEGCFILEARDVEGTWWCLYATWHLNSYVNHALGSMANAVLVPPVVVEGRLQVGFVATKDIPAEVKLSRVMGVRGEPWL